MRGRGSPRRRASRSCCRRAASASGSASTASSSRCRRRSRRARRSSRCTRGTSSRCSASSRRASAARVRMPFVIMTSQDTHAGTAGLFAEHGHFGLEPSQVTLLLQQRVAALVDDDARFAAAGKYELLTKPHGHGDVHVLLHRAGLAARWLKEGRKWVMFFQDTSTLYFSTFLATLGVSARRQLDLNFACMPRRAGMALQSPRDDDARRQRRRHARRAGRVQPAAASVEGDGRQVRPGRRQRRRRLLAATATRTRSSPRCRCTLPSSRGRADGARVRQPKVQEGRRRRLPVADAARA